MPEFLHAYQRRIQQQLDHRLQNVEIPATLLKAMRYAALNGGKRIRAALVYAAGEYCHADLALLDDAAIALETMHAFSLIHDDLPAMDNDTLRRGKPTCHIAFDEATAILAGDALQTFAFETLSQPDGHTEKRLKMLRCLAQASGAAGMAGGQWLDIDATDKTLTLAQLQQMHQLKTGKLISAAIMLGVLAGETDPSSIQALQRYAEVIGLGFQIRDDILDATAPTQQLGKTANKDQQQHKSTFVTLLGLANAKQRAKETLTEALAALNTLTPMPRTLMDLAHYVIARKH